MPSEKSIFNINGTDFPLSDPNAVKFDRQQSLTSQQKAQAIANMGISDVFEGLLYRGEWNGHALSHFEGNGFWFVPANTLTASADLPGEYQTTKEAVYAIIDLDPSDLTTSPLKCIQYLAWLESYMPGNVVLKVYRRPAVSGSAGALTVYEWENASAPVDMMKSIAIIVSGDRASMAVPVGGYAYIKDNTHGLAEGLYTNTSSAEFPTVGGTADSTVFTAVSGGGLNAIQQSMATFKPGDNYFEKVFAIGYTTGSGNYFDFFIPGDASQIASVTSVTCLTGSSCMKASGGRIDIDGTLNIVPQYTVISPAGITLEVRFASTQTPNMMICVILAGLHIACT